jgi:hypothetical protein
MAEVDAIDAIDAEGPGQCWSVYRSAEPTKWTTAVVPSGSREQKLSFLVFPRSGASPASDWSELRGNIN